MKKNALSAFNVVATNLLSSTLVTGKMHMILPRFRRLVRSRDADDLAISLFCTERGKHCPGGPGNVL
jgi:hypothetical protein